MTYSSNRTKGTEPECRATWRWFDVPLILLVGVLGAAVVLIAGESVSPGAAGNPDLFALCVGAGLCAGVLAGALWRRVGPRALGLRGARSRWWWTALLVAALWAPLRVLPFENLSSFSPSALFQARPGDVAFSILAAAMLVPLGEELFYRGVLYRWLRSLVPLWPALALSAALFAAAHWSGHPLQAMLVLGSGLLYAWLFERSGSLLPGILVHALVNLSALLLTLARG